MTISAANAWRGARTLLVGATVLIAGGTTAYVAGTMSKSSAATSTSAAAAPEAKESEKIARVGSAGLTVPAETVEQMGLTTATAERPDHPIDLPPFQGVLALDNERLSRVRSRFAGEVVEVGCSTSEGEATACRIGDRVHKGDLLAVIWSKDLGEKKSELVDAIAKARSEEQILSRMRSLFQTGAGAERSVRDAERSVQAARVDVARAERTLRTWRLTDKDLAAVRAEAERLIALDERPAEPKDWARVEVRAPLDGVILEKNVAAGDIIETTTDLFKVGDITHLAVWAHVYEEDLSLLESLPRPIHWTVSVPSRSGASFSGALEKIGAVIDPAQHTALVSGRVENPAGDLKVGQFVTVTVHLPPRGDELQLTSSAVVDDGRESVVFVQPDADDDRFVRQPVQIVRRLRDAIYVKSSPDGLKSGDRIVTSGALMLQSAMSELPAAAEPAKELLARAGTSRVRDAAPSPRAGPRTP